MDRSELFIVEGDSALGTAKLARNSEFQALLPIRGKILNVQKSSVSDMLKNAECGAIIQVIGAGSGRTFDIDRARTQGYGFARLQRLAIEHADRELAALDVLLEQHAVVVGEGRDDRLRHVLACGGEAHAQR